MVSADVNTSSHCFYLSFGSQGKAIIGAALRHRVYRRNNKSNTILFQDLQSTIQEVINEHPDSSITLPGFWDPPSNSPYIKIDLEDFFDFIALSHAVNLLIGEDMNLSEYDANLARIESMDYGETIHPENRSLDDTLFEISLRERV